MLTAKLPQQITESQDNGTEEHRRENIDWDLNYGKTFKIVQKPSQQESIEDSTIIVTPHNISEVSNWPEVPQKTLYRLKRNWDKIQKNLSEHKYKEIICCIKNLYK